MELQRILIFGNSGSGKTTLAARLRDASSSLHTIAG
jgi:adenylate kinase family enzyme